MRAAASKEDALQTAQFSQNILKGTFPTGPHLQPVNENKLEIDFIYSRCDPSGYILGELGNTLTYQPSLPFLHWLQKIGTCVFTLGSKSFGNLHVLGVAPHLQDRPEKVEHLPWAVRSHHCLPQSPQDQRCCLCGGRTTVRATTLAPAAGWQCTSHWGFGLALQSLFFTGRTDSNTCFVWVL